MMVRRQLLLPLFLTTPPLFASWLQVPNRRHSPSLLLQKRRLTSALLPPVNLNHFRLLRVVGKGAFGKVRIVERKDTGLTFALKYIRKDEGTLTAPRP